jgi:hypothetical protein
MEPAEIVKEYVVQVSGLDHSVKARIIKSIEGESRHLFLAQISHYCKPDESAAEVYRPSFLFNNFTTTETRVLDYLKNFTTIDVTVNERY